MQKAWEWSERDMLVHEVVAEQAARFPDCVAVEVVTDKQVWTSFWHELWTKICIGQPSVTVELFDGTCVTKVTFVH